MDNYVDAKEHCAVEGRRSTEDQIAKNTRQRHWALVHIQSTFVRRHNEILLDCHRNCSRRKVDSILEQKESVYFEGKCVILMKILVCVVFILTSASWVSYCLRYPIKTHAKGENSNEVYSGDAFNLNLKKDDCVKLMCKLNLMTRDEP